MIKYYSNFDCYLYVIKYIFPDSDHLILINLAMDQELKVSREDFVQYFSLKEKQYD